jgi:hypothetical protein
MECPKVLALTEDVSEVAVVPFIAAVAAKAATTKVPIVQALAEGSHEVRRVNELRASQEPDHGHRRLLGPCGERPRRDRAANRLRVVSKECLPGAHALGLG